MSQLFACEICGVTRSDEEGAGQWFTVGINDYQGRDFIRKHVNVFGWPLGCRSKTDTQVKHACSVTHMLKVVEIWAELEGAKKEDHNGD